MSEEWELVGIVEEGGVFQGTKRNFVTSFSDIPLVEYLTADCECSHCRRPLARNKLYVIKNLKTEETRMVGSTCIKDFLGHDIEGVLFLAGITTEAFSCFYNEENAKESYDLESLVRASFSILISDNCFISGKKSREEGVGSTSRKVFGFMSALS